MEEEPEIGNGLATVLGQMRLKLGIDRQCLLMMAKGALAPTLVAAIEQSDSVAGMTLTLGHLAALIAVSAQCLVPRGKYIKVTFFSLLAVSIAACICCLACFTAIIARKSGDSSRADPESAALGEYDGSASAVSAIWLFTLIWVANALRAWRPAELQDSMVAVSIFSGIILTRSGTFQHMAEAFAYISRVYKTFLFGYAVATGVSLFILPMTYRTSVMEGIAKQIIQVQNAFSVSMRCVENSSGLATPRPAESDKIEPTDASASPTPADSDAASLRETIKSLNVLDEKIRSDLVYATGEVAIGKLAASDLVALSKLLRTLIRPLSGLALLPEVIERTRSHKTGSPGPETALLSDDSVDGVLLMNLIRDSLSETGTVLTISLRHVLSTLELTDTTSTSQDCAEGHRKPMLDLDGNPFDFGLEGLPLFDELQRCLQAMSSQQRLAKANVPDGVGLAQGITQHEETRKYLSAHPSLLYLICLQNMISRAILNLVLFARQKLSDGTMKRRRLVYPSTSPLAKLFQAEKTPKLSENSRQPRQGPGGILVIDAEHQAPAGFLERASDQCRRVSRLLRSELSMFGLRVAVASFCIAIVAFLAHTHDFFIRQRGIWALIVVVIGMSPTSGQSFYGFVTRILATVVSVILSLIAWYIVNGKPPGVIIFLFLANMIEYYVYIKKPQLFGPSVIAIVTLNIIIAYQLQAHHLGKEVVESTGQLYYPVYIFGPYKLATVVIACSVSLFWVIFPYPITSKSKVPVFSGRSIWSLARIHSGMQAMVQLSANSSHPPADKSAACAAKLDAILDSYYGEEARALAALNTHIRFASYEPPVGGTFPVQIYREVAARIEHIFGLMALMAQVGKALAGTYHQDAYTDEETSWINHMIKTGEQQSYRTISLLCHLSSALCNLQPLPPFLSVEEVPLVLQYTERVTNDTGQLQNHRISLFGALVTLKVLRGMIDVDMKTLLEYTRLLVGEVIIGI